MSIIDNGRENVPIILIGNKLDLDDSRKIYTE